MWLLKFSTSKNLGSSSPNVTPSTAWNTAHAAAGYTHIHKEYLRWLKCHIRISATQPDLQQITGPLMGLTGHNRHYSGTLGSLEGWLITCTSLGSQNKSDVLDESQCDTFQQWKHLCSPFPQS